MRCRPWRLPILLLTFSGPACAPSSAPSSAPIDLGRALGGGATEGYLRATEPRPFHFPEDHGPHRGFRNEWWYFTGNLVTARGRRFGYQLTLFRSALTPNAAARESSWAANHVWMGHFALTDVKGGTFYASDRWEREALGLAGAQVAPLRVWLNDWSIEGPFPLELRAEAEGVGLSLQLADLGGTVLQGDRGLSRKSETDASYYYSMPRLGSRGTVRLRGEDHPVEGTSWMDREWSTSALSEEQVGWDWFSLQLEDGSALMFYRLRRRDGSEDRYSAGTWIPAGGASEALSQSQVEVEPLRTWRSPRSGVRYPSGWRLEIPDRDLELTLEPLLQDQELDLAVRYWEGAVRVVGRRGKEPIRGYGYVELTGYDVSVPKG